MLTKNISKNDIDVLERIKIILDYINQRLNELRNFQEFGHLSFFFGDGSIN